MRFATILAALAAVPMFGQVKAPGTAAPQKAPTAAMAKAPASGPVVTAQGSPRPSRQLMGGIERQFDDKLVTADVQDQIDVIGPTRGLYLDGFGVVFTTEASLIQTPNTSPFKPVITDTEKASLHARKLKHLPLMRAAMKDMIMTIAGALTSVSFNDQVVLSMRLLYFPWENTTGLPSQITMKGDRKSVLSGMIQTVEE